MFSTAYESGVPWNDTHWENARFQELLLSARAELDEGKRAAMYKESQQLLNDDGGALIPMFANHIMAAGKNVGHGENIAANWEMDGNKAHERWWLNS